MVHKVHPGSISIQLGSWEGKKTELEILRAVIIIFFKIFIFLGKKKEELGNLWGK
jgi:hypothetical protein